MNWSELLEPDAVRTPMTGRVGSDPDNGSLIPEMVPDIFNVRS